LSNLAQGRKRADFGVTIKPEQNGCRSIAIAKATGTGQDDECNCLWLLKNSFDCLRPENSTR
jgi:hypothetical protein